VWGRTSWASIPPGGNPSVRPVPANMLQTNFSSQIDKHTIMEIPRIDEQKVNVAFLINEFEAKFFKKVREKKNTYNSNFLHVSYKRREISESTTRT